MFLRTKMVCIVMTLLLVACSSSLKKDHKREMLPNIVLFLVDDMGLMDTSVPFITDNNNNPAPQPLNKWYKTPNMENLA